MGNQTHQNVNGPYEHDLHLWALLGEHEPRCHPRRDLPPVEAPGAAAPHWFMGSSMLPGVPCGGLLSTSQLRSRKGQRGNFSKFQAHLVPRAGSGLAAFTSLGNTGQALQLFPFPLQLPA